MLNITAEQITAAKNNEIDAVTHLIRETEERVIQIARKHAASGGSVNHSLAEELAQVGRVTVWEVISTFEGEDPAQFFTYIDRHVSGAISAARREETRQGVSTTTSKFFETALSAAAGDPYEAERLVQDADFMGDRRMSPERAYSARMAWQGTDSLDAPLGADSEGGEERTLGDTIVSTYGVPDDLVTASDIESARRKETRTRVRRTLDKMGKRKGDVIRGTYGIAPAPMAFGTDNEDMLAAWLDMPKAQVRQNRAKGHARFAELYLKGETV
ncbi:hypothetical protein ACFYZ4_15065 [Streptomyces sp. NPDC001513]|uniref:hypothetical protein n=1 Tax=Streptomyces sp. NPDC001513 TaxID=3364580 RepID=UPI00368D1C70